MYPQLLFFIGLSLQKVTFYGSKLWETAAPSGTFVEIEGMTGKAVVHDGGLLLPGNDGKFVS